MIRITTFCLLALICFGCNTQPPFDCETYRKDNILGPEIFGVVNGKAKENDRPRLTFVQNDREWGMDVGCFGDYFWNAVKIGDKLIKSANEDKIMILRDGQTTDYYYCTCENN